LSIEIIERNIGDLIEAEYNPRKLNQEQYEHIKSSLQRFGIVDPVLVNVHPDRKDIIIGGHQRTKVWRDLGNKTISCVELSLDLDKEKELNVRLNKNTGEFDFEMLSDHFEMEDLVDWGFDESEFDLELDDEPEIEEDDFEGELPEEPKTELGRIYQLGKHRLMCGDSTSEKDVALLMNGEKADMVFTDPPYNVAFNGRSGKHDVIMNDDLSDNEFGDFITKTIAMIKQINAPVHYVWCNWKFYGILQGELEYKSCIVWAKNVFGLGRGYRHQHEFCLYNGKMDDGINNESDLWEIKKDHNYVHPTQKPVALSMRALKNHKKAMIIVDLFGGSGSTLLGCEQSKREGRIMELDPKYCDVIVQRYCEFKGIDSEKVFETGVAE